MATAHVPPSSADLDHSLECKIQALLGTLQATKSRLATCDLLIAHYGCPPLTSDAATQTAREDLGSTPVLPLELPEKGPELLDRLDRLTSEFQGLQSQMSRAELLLEDGWGRRVLNARLLQLAAGVAAEQDNVRRLNRGRSLLLSQLHAHKAALSRVRGRERRLRTAVARLGELCVSLERGYQAMLGQLAEDLLGVAAVLSPHLQLPSPAAPTAPSQVGAWFTQVRAVSAHVHHALRLRLRACAHVPACSLAGHLQARFLAILDGLKHKLLQVDPRTERPGE